MYLFRNERSTFIFEFNEKLEDYNNSILKNEKLTSFLRLWKAKMADNCYLTGLLFYYLYVQTYQMLYGSCEFCILMFVLVLKNLKAMQINLF